MDGSSSYGVRLGLGEIRFIAAVPGSGDVSVSGETLDVDGSITADEVTFATTSDANLASDYDFENTVADAAGSVDGTVIGTSQFSATVPAAISGRSTAAFDFNGSSAVSLPIGDIDPYALVKSTGLSVSFWVAAPPQSEGFAFSVGNTSAFESLYGVGSGYSAPIRDNLKLVNRGPDGDRTEALTTTDNIYNNQYHHVVITDNNGQAAMYINGVQDLTDFNYTIPAIDTATFDVVGIGAILGPVNRLFLNGKVDEFAIYDRALTAAEVSRLASGITPTSAAFGQTDFSGSITSNTVNVPSNLVVETGSRFGGIGSIDGSVTVESGGTFAPGNSPGILNTGNFDLQAGSTLEIEIGGLAAGNTLTDHDQVNVTGSVTLAGDITALRFKGFNPAASDTFTIISNDGADAVNGTFNGLIEGASFTSDNVTYRGNHKRGHSTFPNKYNVPFCDFLGFRNFLLRSLEKMKGEWQLVCLVHNLLKLFRSGAHTTT